MSVSPASFHDRKNSNTPPMDDFIYYQSQGSLIPFSLTHYTSNGDKIADRLKLDKMDKRIERFNKLVQHFHNTGWLQYMSVEFEILKTDVIFEFKVSRALLANVESVRAIPLFTYNMTHGRVTVEADGRGFIPLKEYFYTHNIDKESAERAYSAYKRYHFSIEQFINYLDESFRRVERVVHKTYPDLEYGVFQFIQTLIIMNASLNRGHIIIGNRQDMRFVLGDAENWAPYLFPDANIQNLVYLFTFNFVGTDTSKIKFGFPSMQFQGLKERWKGQYLYSVEEIRDALPLPHEWFVKLFPVQQVLDGDSL